MADDIRSDVQDVLNEIRSGNWDDQLVHIERAINERNQALKTKLLARVREVFGKDARIITGEEKPEIKQDTNTNSNPFVRKANMQDDAVEIKEPMPELDSLESKMIQEAGEGPSIGRGGAMIGGMGPQDFR